jgi:hypothetical protein
MAELPTLSREEVETALRLLLDKRRNHHLFAFWGTGTEMQIEVKGECYPVVPVDSELDLRLKLPDIADVDPRCVYLVPFDSLPRDVEGLFALGRVERIGREQRLASMLGVTELEEGVSRSVLGDLLLRGRTTLTRGRVSRPVTPRGLVTAWLAEHWEFPTGHDFGRDGVLAWAASNERGAEFLSQFASAPGLIEELDRQIGAAAGRVGRIAFQAWSQRKGQELFELAAICESARSSKERVVEVWLRAAFKSFQGVDAALASEAVPELGEAFGRALLALERRTSSAFVKARLSSADARVDDPDVRSALAEAPGQRLKLHYEAHWQRLTLRLEAVLATLDGSDRRARVAALRAGVDAFEAIKTHQLANAEEDLLERAHNALRLAFFLDAASIDERLRLDPLSPELGRIARWYVDEGGHLDRARQGALGPSVDRTGRVIAAIVDVATERRVELDRRFARALSEWVDSGRPKGAVLAIEDALAHIAKPFLEAAEDRRLLVILLDGMAWTQASELLEALAHFEDGWAPLHFNSGRTDASQLPVVLAGIPTLTEVSRTAFFAGRRMESGETHRTEKDPDRLRANKAIAPFFKGVRAPRLFLRAEGQTRGGVVANEVMTEIADEDSRLVALVINTIDDSLKNNPTQRQRWDLSSIAPLRSLLTAARKAGRYVLFASDHGHVRSAGLETLNVRTDGEGRRWRHYMNGMATTEHETVLKGRSVWTPKGADGVVLLHDETARYGPSGHSGEHGGASLAEVVAPCVLVGWDEPLSPSSDLRLLGRYAPAWYRLDVTEPEAKRARKGPVSVSGKSSPQLTLTPRTEPPQQPVEAPTKASKPLSVRPTQPIEALLSEPPSALSPEAPAVFEEASALAKSELFKQQVPVEKRAEMLRALRFLKGRGGAAPAETFAQHMNYQPMRARSLVASLAEKLSLDGEQPLSFEYAGQRVVLDLAKFKALYGEEP